MDQREKLLNKALRDPKSLRFEELCQLAEYYGFKLSRTRGSHRMYKREGCARLLNFQGVGGKAKSYQVRQLLDAIEELGLAKDE